MFNQLLRKYGESLKSRRRLIIAFLLVIIWGSVAWLASLCTVDVEAMPLQIIYIEAAPVTTLSKADLSSTGAIPGFTNFVSSVTEHLVTKLAQKKLCLNSIESKKHSLLQFVHLPFNTIPQDSVPPFEAEPFGVCRITSPWMDLVVEREPIPLVRGVFRYNERQLLADQAVLAEAHNVPPGVAMPLTNEELRQYAFEYVSSEILRQPAAKPIEERVPADLLWLFRRANQSYPSSFWASAIGSTGEAMRIRSGKYAQIVIALIDQCFESDGADLQYNSILDVADLVSLEEYKIETSIVTYRER